MLRENNVCELYLKYLFLDRTQKQHNLQQLLAFQFAYANSVIKSGFRKGFKIEAVSKPSQIRITSANFVEISFLG